MWLSLRSSSLTFFVINGLEGTPFDEVVVCAWLGAAALAVVVLVEPGAGVLDPVVTPATPAVVVVGVDVVGVVVLAAAVVTVLVVAGFEPEPPARLTSAAASTPNDSATTTASVAIRPFQ
jgi:hypothetical protein